VLKAQGPAGPRPERRQRFLKCPLLYVASLYGRTYWNRKRNTEEAP